MALRWTRKRLALVGGAVLVLIAVLAVAAFALAGSADVVVYNGRSQYGDEQAFKAFEEETGLDVELRGGTAPELFERLRREGAETPADLLVTTDLANLWRAKDAGLLEPVDTPALQQQVPERLHDTEGAWWGLSTRIRTPMRSSARVGADAVTSYEDLGKPQFRGKLCLRTSNNEYNQSFVADRIAKKRRGRDRGAAALLDGQPASHPRLRRRRARRDQRRPLRRRAHQPLLPRPRAQGEPEVRRRPRVGRPGWCGRAHEPLGRGARQGLRAPRERDPADGVPDRARGAGGDRLQQRVRRQRRRRARAAHPRMGRREDGPDRRRAGRRRR